MSDEIETRLGAAGASWASARMTAGMARNEVQELVIEATSRGMTEARAADLAGCDRMTIRKMRGKS